VHLLERTTLIKAPRADVFSFFEDPHNLSRITPAWMNLPIGAIDPLPIKANFRIEYRMRWLGFGGLKWVTLISDYQPPRYFADEQESGPYKYWRHVHTFDEVDGGALMRDRAVRASVRYSWCGHAQADRRPPAPRHLRLSQPPAPQDLRDGQTGPLTLGGQALSLT